MNMEKSVVGRPSLVVRRWSSVVGLSQLVVVAGRQIARGFLGFANDQWPTTNDCK
jgi:hypothetical protein